MKEHQSAYFLKPGQRFDIAFRALGRIDLMLQNPGESQWPKHLRLDTLPTDTDEEKAEFLKASCKVIDCLEPLKKKTKPILQESLKRLEEQIEVEKMVIKIEESVERKKSGLIGLSETILFKAKQIQKNIFSVAAHTNNSKKSQDSSFALSQKIEIEPKNGQITDQKEEDLILNRLDVLELSPREADVVNFFLKNPQKVFTRHEIAPLIWTKEEGFSVEKAVTNFSAVIVRLNTKLKGKAEIVNTTPGKGHNSVAHYHLIRTCNNPNLPEPNKKPQSLLPASKSLGNEIDSALRTPLNKLESLNDVSHQNGAHEQKPKYASLDYASKITETPLAQIIEQTQVKIARVILSHLALDNMKMLTTEIYELIASNVPDKKYMGEILEYDDIRNLSHAKLEEFVVAAIFETIKRVETKRENISVEEMQIIRTLSQLKNKRIDEKKILRIICRHFLIRSEKYIELLEETNLKGGEKNE